MKFFNKKNVREEGLSVSGNDQPEFYSNRSGETPLDESYEGAGGGPVRRTSRHSPVQRRENDNRASNITLGLFLLRAVLIVVLLGGGFIGLKLIAKAVSGPSDADRERWAEKARLMEQGASPDTGVAPETARLSETSVSDELIKTRIERWTLAERHLRSADSLIRRGIHDKAVERLLQVLQASPHNRAAQQQLLNIYMEDQNYIDAVPLCIRLLDQDSTQWGVQTSLLEALQQSGRNEPALTLADRLLDQKPNDVRVLQVAAVASRDAGDAERALGLYERILENLPESPVALLGSAEIYHEKMDWAEAIPFYLELMRQSPEPEVYHALSQCYAQLGESGKTVIFMGQATSLFGSSEVAPWLRETVFDPVRESVEFRSFADRIVGIETRKAIEAINRREAEKKASSAPETPTLPTREIKSSP